MKERAAVDAAAEKALTFGLADEVYGIGILKVQEIIGMMSVTRVPRMPEHVRGVVNLRGRIVPVLDLRLRFGLPAVEDTDVTCIVVVQVASAAGEITIGLIVDEVREVVDLPTDQIEDVPEFGAGVHTEFIRGMGKLGQQVVLLLDIDEVLSAQSLGDIAALSESA